MLRLKLSLAIFYAFAICLVQNNAVAKQPVTMSIIESEKGDTVYNFAQKLVDEVSKISDLDIRLIAIPAKRATQMLLNNTLQAEFYRIESYTQKVPHSIKIAASESLVPIFAYSASVDFKVNGWQSLKPFSMINVRGWIYPKKNLPEKEFIVVNSTLDAFAMLEARRAEIFVNSQITSTAILQSTAFKDTKIRRLSPKLGHIKFFTFFSGKYPKMAESYNSAIKEIKSNGTFERLVAEFF
jgi:polar amino acid transport system substrate-binding protein